MARPLLIIVLTSTLITGQYFQQYSHQQQYYQLPNQQQQNFHPYSQTVHQPQQQYQYNGFNQQKQQIIYQNPGIHQYNKVYYPQSYQQPMIPSSIQNYQPTQIIKNLQPYQSQYQQQVFEPQNHQQQYRQQFIQQPYPQYSQQPYQNNIVKQSSMPQVYNYESQQNNQQQQYQIQNINPNTGPIQLPSNNDMRERISQQKYNYPQQSQQYKYSNIPTISPPTYRSNTVVKVIEKLTSPQYQAHTYIQDGSFTNSADVPPPPPPEKFLPEKTIIQKVRVASETKGTNFIPSNFHVLDEVKIPSNKNNHKIENNVKQDNIEIQSTDNIITTTQQLPIINNIKENDNKNEKKIIPKNQVSHLSPSKDSTVVNDVFLKCCHRKNVSPKCESRCNFDIINKKILTAMFLGSDPCPQSYGRDLFSCAAQDGDHTDCCRKMNVTRTTAGEKCLAFCKMTPDTHFQADVTYLPCWSVLNDIKQCFKNAIIDSL
ncbi:Domain of unknown function DB domain-containing protein [Strongyloides ratti]|uniref:DB domain-containing protein n=1 Tax=Strongyloides ratti TaxID=34506 RepID=A0A090LT96_STRRB|nr:Domain of unknown function DB domain-containing protein [Strongyloides ratti]CEF71442.1 Domain of unknown function DB domain-containing protein [Strongyloides ratti]